MSKQLEELLKKRNETEQNKSIRTIKSISNYNISDYLPASRDISHSQIVVNKNREKTVTECNEKGQEVQLRELMRKNQMLEQEKMHLKSQLLSSKKDAEQSQLEVVAKEKEIEGLKVQLQQLLNNFKEKTGPKLSLCRNSFQQQVFPKHKQLYQVSIQTESIFEQQQKPKQNKSITFSTDSQMQQIYQKLDNLKMIKRKSQANKTPILTAMKTDKPRIMTFNDKQNLIRASNLSEKTFGFSDKPERVKEQSSDLYCMSLEKGERLLSAYLDEQFI